MPRKRISENLINMRGELAKIDVFILNEQLDEVLTPEILHESRDITNR